MADRRPLVIVGGVQRELDPADTLALDSRLAALLAIANRNGDRPVPLAYSYWGDTADNSSAGPTTFSSGQAAIKVESAGTHWITANGKMTIPTPSGAGACYFSTGDLGAVVTHVGGRFTFSNNDPGGEAAIAITNSIVAPTGSMPSMSCHLHTGPYGWTFGVWAGADNGGGGETILANGYFNFAAGMVPGVEYEMEAWLVGTTATFRLPDGSIHSVTDSRISSYAGNYALCETIVGASGDCVAQWSHFWCNIGLAIPGGPGPAAVSGSSFSGTTSFENILVKTANPPVAGDIMVCTTGTGDGSGGDTMWSPILNAIPQLGAYQTILEASGSHIAAKVAGTYAIPMGDALAVSGTGTLYPLQLINIQSADFPSGGGLTPKLRVRATVSVNNVAPTGNFTVGLYPVTSGAGGAGLKIYTMGTVVSGSAATTVTTPAASSMTSVAGSDFALPSNGVYCLAVVTTATVATSSLVHVNAQLQMRNA